MTPAAPSHPTRKRPAGVVRRKPSTLSNVFANYGVFLFTAVASFFLSPFVVHSLGNEIYGTWSLLISLVGYLGLLDLGVRGAVTRFIANKAAAKDHEAASRYASAGLFLFTLTATGAVLIGAAIALGFTRIFDLSPELVLSAQIAVFLGGVTMATSFIGGVYGGVVIGMERFDLSGGTEVGVQVLRIVAIVVALNAGYALVALAVIQLGAGLLRLGISVLLSRLLYPELVVSFRHWSRSDLSAILDFSIVATILRGASVVMLQLDAVVLGLFHPVALLAFYAVGSNLVVYAREMVAAIGYTITPRISALEGAGDVADTHRLPLLSARLAALVMLPIIVTFLTRGDTFIGLWMGEEYAAPSGQVLWILSLGLWFAAGRGVLAAAFMGLNQHRSLVVPMCVEALMNLGLSLLWVRDYGLNGVAWGTAVPALLMNVAVLPRIYARVLQVGLPSVIANLIVRPSLAIVPFAAASYVCDRVLVAGSVPMFFAQVAMILPLAVAGSWYAGLNRQERLLFGARLAEPVRRWRSADI